MNEPTTWGKSLRDARAAALPPLNTQTGLSRVSGVAQKTISDIETGDVKTPGLFTALRLAYALGFDNVTDLFPLVLEQALPLDDVERVS